jgi:replicative DNA helicase
MSEALEKGVLACALYSEENALAVSCDLSKSDFSFPAYKSIFSTICLLVQEGSEVSTLSVVGHLHGLGVRSFDLEVYELDVPMPDYHAVDQYIDQLKEVSARRKLNEFQMFLQAKLQSGENVQDILSYSQDYIESIRDRKENDNEWIGPDGISKMVMSLLEEEKGITGLPSGLITLDKHTNGFSPGQLIIIAGRPGIGKSSLADRILHTVCFIKKEPAQFYSIEMTAKEFTYRQCSLDMNIPHDSIRKNALSVAEKRQLSLWATDIVPNSSLQIRDGELYIEDLCYKAKRAAKNGISLLMIDYLQLVQSKKPHGTRDEQVGHITRSLKSLAKELNIPVIALCQLNRNPEGRADKRPELSDLRESGNIEQDADMVIFIYREGYYVELNYQEQAELIIAKNRSGETGTVHCWWSGPTMSFQNHAS